MMAVAVGIIKMRGILIYRPSLRDFAEEDKNKDCSLPVSGLMDESTGLACEY